MERPGRPTHVHMWTFVLVQVLLLALPTESVDTTEASTAASQAPTDATPTMAPTTASTTPANTSETTTTTIVTTTISAPGKNCTSSSNCIQNDFCNGSFICQCNDTHYQKDQTCEKRKGVDEECQNLTNSSDSQSNCVNGTVCTQTGTNINKYVCKYNFGSECNGDDNTCIKNGPCQNSSLNERPTCRVRVNANCFNNATRPCVEGATCTGPQNTCQCNSTHYDSGGICLLRKSYNETCKFPPADQSNCIDGTVCVNDTGIPVCKYNFGSICNGDNTCLNNVPCQNSTVQGNKTCRVKVKDKCYNNQTSPCVEGAYCVPDELVCQCNSTHYESNGTCLLRKTFGEVCDTPNIQSNCIDGTLCEKNQSGSTTLVCKYNFGSKCTGDATCVDNALCQNSSGQVEKTCRAVVNISCNSTRPCVEGADCITSNNTCQCNSSYYEDKRNCFPRIPVNGNCTANNLGSVQGNCVNNSICDVDKTCKIPLEGDCTRYTTGVQGACINGTVCDDNRCKWNVGSACSRLSCRNGSECVNVSNNNNKECRWIYGYYNCSGNTCQTDQGMTCTNTNKGTACLCNETSFFYGGKCINDIQLKVTVQQETPVQEKYIYLQWTPVNISNLQVQYMAFLEINSSNWITGTLYNFTNLQPGHSYNCTVTSRVSRNPDHSVDYTNYSSDLFVGKTKPAQPGDIIGRVSGGPNGLMQFYASEGQVNKYNITLTPLPGANISELITYNIFNMTGRNVVNASFTFLTRGGSYNYIITAESGSLYSTPRTGEFRVATAQAGVVSDLKNVTVGSRTINISWITPTDKNGAIKGYTVKVYLNKSCVLGIAVICESTCTNSSNQNPDITECKNKSHVTRDNAMLDSLTYQVQVEVSDLLPDVSYEIEVVAYNDDGNGKPKTITVLTDPEKAADLEGLIAMPLSLKEVGELRVLIEPGERRGKTYYNITWEEQAGLNKNEYNINGSITLEGYGNTTYTITSLLSYWNYRINVTTGTTVGPASRHLSVQNQTVESKPRQVKILNVTRYSKVATDWSVTFSCPDEKERNGKLVNFYINSTLVTNESTVQWNHDNAGGQCPEFFTVNISLKADFTYNISVYAATVGKIDGFPNSRNVYVEPLPPLLDKIYHIKPILEPDVTTVTTQNTGVLLVNDAIFDASQGPLKIVGLLVCRPDVSNCSKTDLMNNLQKDSDLKDGKKVLTWYQFRKQNFKFWYRPTPDDWSKEYFTRQPALRRRRSLTSQHRSPRATSDSENPHRYILGGDTNCTNENDKYCNGPLDPGVPYKVIVCACTSGGCAFGDSQDIRTQKIPETSDSKGAIVGGVLGAAAAIAIIAVVVFFLYRKNKLPCRDGEKVSRNGSFSSIDVRGPKRYPIKLKDFNEHLDRLHKDSNLLFQGEFEDVQEHSPKHFTQDAAALDGNKVKNRYVNILPYDHTRVKLTTDDEDEVSDFINANYIPGYTSPREYIATQGPMVSTIAHFWRMMWEQKSTVIVMLSDLQEKGRPKVDMYWPGELNSPVQYGDVIVELTSDSTLNRYTIRTFKICLETQPEDSRKVVQYFIPGWEDYSANLAAEELMDFISAVRQEVRTPVVGPIVVHCSAGVGRTGTFIALDFLMQFVRDHDLEDEVDIYNLVLNMRHNRPYMVQSERQYIFIHDALKVIIDKKIKEMKKDDDNIYQNEDNIYQNQAFVQDENLYENTSYNSKPITSL